MWGEGWWDGWRRVEAVCWMCEGGSGMLWGLTQWRMIIHYVLMSLGRLRRLASFWRRSVSG